MKKNVLKKLTQQTLWTFEYLKMELTFKSPYYNHLLMDFDVFIYF